jgi:hypothetical protein
MEVASIKIQFYLSNRRPKNKLLRIARQFACLREPVSPCEPFEIRLDESCRPEDFPLVSYFWRLIYGYKDTAVYCGDRLLTTRQAATVLEWINCYNNREYFPDQKEYCRGMGWPCRCLYSVKRNYFGRGVHWSEIGPEQDGIRYIDKEDIKEKLLHEAELKGLSICPLFNLNNVLQAVQALPDSVEIGQEVDL